MWPKIKTIVRNDKLPYALRIEQDEDGATYYRFFTRFPGSGGCTIYSFYIMPDGCRLDHCQRLGQCGAGDKCHSLR